jgi:hypothetical protein
VGLLTLNRAAISATFTELSPLAKGFRSRSCSNADRVQQVGEAGLNRGGRGGVGVDAEDAAPAAGEADHGAGVVVGGPVGGLPGGLEALEGLGADRLLDLGGDIGGLGGFEDAGVAPGQDQGGGLAGGCRGRRRRR